MAIALSTACFRLIFTGAAKENFIGWGGGIGHRPSPGLAAVLCRRPDRVIWLGGSTILHR